MRGVAAAVALAVLVMGVACGGFSGDGGDGTASTDAGTDAPADAVVAVDGGAPQEDASSSPCPLGPPRRLLAADFDSAPPTYTSFGTPFALPAAPAGATRDPLPPGTSGPNGLWITATTASYVLNVPAQLPSGKICGFEASFALSFSTVPADVPDLLFARVAIQDPAFDHCFVGITLDAATKNIVLSSHCGGTGADDVFAYQFLSPVPALDTYQPVTLKVDFGTGKAKAQLGGRTAQIDLGAPSALTGGTAGSVLLGLDSASDMKATRIGYDDVLVDVR